LAINIGILLVLSIRNQTVDIDSKVFVNLVFLKAY